MSVRQAMLPEPITTTADESFGDLLRRVVVSRQATAAVLDGENRLLGLVGIHDILRRLVPAYIDLDEKLMEVMHEGYLEEHLAKLTPLVAGELMTTKIDSVGLDDTLIKAAALMVEHRRKTLPVLDDDGRFLGMITRRSLLERVAANVVA